VARIFINYRRGDTTTNASRLCEWLGERYGEDQVFMDVDAIEPGLDWAKAIESAVGSADLVLAMIGNDWLNELKRRSADQDDFMRYELETALGRDDIRVIPVLVEGAKMPPAGELPESLASLTRRQAFEIRDERFRFDKEELFRRVDRALEAKGVVVTHAKPLPQSNGHAASPPVEPAADGAAVETELRKWNWGAFLLGPIWGIGHGVFRSLLTLVPIYGIYEWIMLGRHGNRWAWEQRRWDSIESFRKTQRKWAMWGAIISTVLVLIVVGSSG
jgi:TIR domain